MRFFEFQKEDIYLFGNKNEKCIFFQEKPFELTDSKLGKEVYKSLDSVFNFSLIEARYDTTKFHLSDEIGYAKIMSFNSYSTKIELNQETEYFIDKKFAGDNKCLIANEMMYSMFYFFKLSYKISHINL